MEESKTAGFYKTHMGINGNYQKLSLQNACKQLFGTIIYMSIWVDPWPYKATTFYKSSKIYVTDT